MSGTGPNVPNDSAEVTRYEKTSTRPARHCSQECSRSFGEHPKAALAARSCSIVLCGQAPKPRSGAPKARGLTAKPRIERRLAAMHVGIGHVREIKYQILQTLSPRASPDLKSKNSPDKISCEYQLRKRSVNKYLRSNQPARTGPPEKPFSFVPGGEVKTPYVRDRSARPSWKDRRCRLGNEVECGASRNGIRAYEFSRVQCLAAAICSISF